ncbi:MAG: calcium-translocating P-type ATPase, PMCA-type [Clostridia bacterium]|nr:calcium-translocating P-type ATPase, PMCA-type [Clostridia bacterium]
MEQTFTKSADDVITAYQSSKNGLSHETAKQRYEEYGKNELEEGKRPSLIARFFAQFADMMIIVLLVAAIVSAVISIVQGQYTELIDSGLILLIVIVNAVIGVSQEAKAETALDSLKSMNKPFCKVVRDGEVIHIPCEYLVPGDIVQLEAGDIVPADLRLISSTSLKIEEAALTGESVPVDKHADLLCESQSPIGDRVNMAYSSGIVSYGRGRGIVVDTAMDTEVGKIARMLSAQDDGVTPLQRQLSKTAKLLSIVVLGIAAVIFLASWIKGTNMLDAFMTSVAIAVAAIPEGLPAVVTIVLAIGVQRMSKRNAIIRNLPAVETLGCCEIICSDKTGTLTLNQMTVKQLYTVSNDMVVADNATQPDCGMTDDARNDFRLLVRAMALCNDTNMTQEGKFTGDPTETALVYYAEKCGMQYAQLCDNWKRIDEIPFDSIRKLMTTVNCNGQDKLSYTKGAPDILLRKCTRILDNGKIRLITDLDINKIEDANYNMATNALRVLGVAIKQDGFAQSQLEQDLIFVGLVGMIDPPRPEVKDAVAVCKNAGMRPIMITGDHIVTASAIAREVGILEEGQKVMLGADIDKLSDEEFSVCITEYSVFARVSPENKVRIVKAYRSLDCVVAMTGDGVNDAPSIKEADIGIGMGITGTDVSKGASDMVLADDNFATIIGAVEEGRKIYSNIKKAIQYLLSANIAEVLCLFIATIFIGKDFLSPVMILWINLVTDSLPALALGMEEAEHDVMNYPPRKTRSSLFAGKTGRDTLIQGVMQTALVMAVFCIGEYVLDTGSQHESIAMTMAFVSLCFIQLFHAYNLRSQRNSLFSNKLFNNRTLNLSFIIGTVLVVTVTLIPAVINIFDGTTLTLTQWAISVGMSLLIIPLVELQKAIERCAYKRSRR